MSRTNLFVLFLLGVSVAGLVAWFQNSPGYMDADYYMAGALRLVQGHGFSEIILWNYLADPAGLPNPSHSYWMPLASLIAAFGMWVSGQHDFFAARIPFIFLAGLVPPLTALLAYRLTGRRELALLSGLLAAFPTYNVSYLAAIDNFSVFRILGALFLLLLGAPTLPGFFALGLVAGLMNLSRTDGLLWFGLAFVALILHLYATYTWDVRRWFKPLLASGTLILAGYLLVMSPWFGRNLSEFGTLMAPGGSRAALLVSYDDTFIYPASDLSAERWLASGWPAILEARFRSFGLNLGTSFLVFAGIFLGPFTLLGLWKFRQDLRVQVGAFGFFALFLVMTFVFPFAGTRGSFLHAGVAFTPLGWALAPVGLEMAIGAARRRNWFTPQAQRIFRLILFAANLALTLPLIHERIVAHDWDESDQTFRLVETRLLQSGADPFDVVMVTNPPGYYLASGRPAVASPHAELNQVFEAAERYDVRYLILQRNSIPDRLLPLLDRQESAPELRLLFIENPDLVVYEFILEQ